MLIHYYIFYWTEIAITYLTIIINQD